MVIAFWGNEKSSGLELLCIHQFLELLSKEDIIQEGERNKEGLNVVIEGIGNNASKRPTYLYMLSLKYCEPIDLAESIIPSEKDEYSKINQLLEGEIKKLNSQLTMPSPDIMKQLEKEKIGCYSIPYVSFKLGPFEHGKQKFRLYLHIADVKYKMSDIEKRISCYYTGLRTSVPHINNKMENSEFFPPLLNKFKKYFHKDINRQIIYPHLSLITVIDRIKDNTRFFRMGTGSPKIIDSSYFTYTESENYDLIINLELRIKKKHVKITKSDNL